MKIDTAFHTALPYETPDHGEDSTRTLKTAHGSRLGRASPRAGTSMQARSPLSPTQPRALQSTATPDSREVRDQTGDLAKEAVIGNDMASEMTSFNTSLAAIHDDIEAGNDTTGHAIAAASAYDNLLHLSKADKPTPGQQEKIGRLSAAMQNAKGDESLDTLGKQANVDLSALKPHADSASAYAKYGKAASTYTRALIFDEARFNNSALLKNSPFALLQRPNKSVLDPLGLNGRLGILTGTRLNAAGGYFTKGALSFMSGMEKMRKGDDPTKDFISAAATTGQGINELTVGIGTDVGNHLVKLQQAKAKALADNAAPPGKQNGIDAPGTPVDKSGPTSAYADFQTQDPRNGLIDETELETIAHIDDNLTQQQKNLRDEIIGRVEQKPRDVQQLELQDATNEIAPRYLEMSKLAQQFTNSASQAADDAHNNIKTIDSKANDVISKLQAKGFDTADAARRSDNPEALELCKQLDQFGDLKRAAYDQFNSAMQQHESAFTDARAAFGELGKVLDTTPASERPSKIAEWSDKYTKFFGERQANILSTTDTWPEWMKISKPLRIQMVPTAINTALGTASFGVALDTYLKKQHAGTLTPQDRLDFGASTINLISGVSGFIPVIGPALSFALATLGVICGGLADQYDARKVETDTYNLKEKVREEFNARHPDSEIAEPYDGD